MIAARPPLAPGVPILGNGLALLKDPLGAFVALYRELGPIYRVRVPGRRYTVLAGPKANAFLLHGGERHLTSEPIYRSVAQQIESTSYPLVASGERHRHLRRALQPALSREAISHHVPRLVRIADEVAREWRAGARVRLPHAIRRIIGEQITHAATSGPLGAHLSDALTVARVTLGAGVGAYPAATVYWPPYRAARRRLRAFFGEAVARHRAEAPGLAREPDLIDILLAATDVEGRPLADADVAVMALMLLATSLLYSATACTFLLYALLREPAVMAQVLAEAEAVLDGGPLDFAALGRMRVLRAALRESMRLYPIALTVPRAVREPFAFEGYRLEAGEHVLIATTVGHFLAENFPDPYRFDITRYEEPRSEDRRPGAWVPFGLGSRPCPGTGLVEIMVMTTVAALLRAVRVQLDPPDYTLRRVVNPFPEAEERMSVRVLERRPPRAAPAAPPRPAEEARPDRLIGLDPERLGRMVAGVETLTFEPGDVIIRQGDRADRFYMIAEGEIEVLLAVAGGGFRDVARLGRHDYFGEIGLLQNVSRTATVRALSPVTVRALDRERFLEVVAENDLTAAEISRLVRQRLVSLQLASALPRLDGAALARLLPRVETLRFAPSTVIVREGDPADRFYVISRGRVEVVNHHPSGDDISLGSLGPGEYFGEIGLLQGRPRMATVRAGAEEVEALSLDREAFEALLGTAPGAREDIGAVMTARLASAAALTAAPPGT